MPYKDRTRQRQILVKLPAPVERESVQPGDRSIRS
jgi:hypothetical protein